MGAVMSFVRVTPEELRRAEDDPEWADEFLLDVHDLRPDDPDGSLEYMWDGIRFLLQAAGSSIDPRWGGSPQDEECSLSGWDVAAVRKAAEELRALPFDRLQVHYDAEEMEREGVYPHIWHERESSLGYLRDRYEVLVGFFEAAAASGSAALMRFSS